MRQQRARALCRLGPRGLAELAQGALQGGDRRAHDVLAAAGHLQKGGVDLGADAKALGLKVDKRKGQRGKSDRVTRPGRASNGRWE